MLRHTSVVVAVLLLSLSSVAQNVSVDQKSAHIDLIAGLEPKLWLAIDNHTTKEQFATAEFNVLTPDGAVRATTNTSLTLQPGKHEVPIAIPMQVEHLPAPEQARLLWFRIHYQIALLDKKPISGVLPLGQITPQLFELRVAAMETVLPGSIYEAKVRATHPLTSAPQAGVSLSGEIDSGHPNSEPLRTSAVTDSRGEATLRFTVPADFHPTYQDCSLNVKGSRASIVREASLNLRNNLPDWAVLSTDKPIYQPGQVLHIRGLLRSMAKKPVPNQAVTLKISDPDDLVVYREELKTSRFGIAHADWQIPDNQRLGDYKITLISADSGDEELGSDIRVKRSLLVKSRRGTCHSGNVTKANAAPQITGTSCRWLVTN